MPGLFEDKHVGRVPTGIHKDGSLCYHKTSHCPEHGSCIDCDMCKLECDCL